jgi:hypothetical protein
MAQNFRDGAWYPLQARIAGVVPIVKFEGAWPAMAKCLAAQFRAIFTAGQKVGRMC